MAVKRPCSGLTPDAIANGMARGKATIPTVVPAAKSEKNCFQEYPSRKIAKIFGSKRVCIDGLDSCSNEAFHSILKAALSSRTNE